MRKIDPKRAKISNEIWEWVCNTLEEISDEIGTAERGEFLLAYEGWSCLCVSKVFNAAKSDKENEDAYYEFAEQQSSLIIEKWIKEHKNYYHIINCGYEHSGLYGVTWALFKECKN